ncbi:hypothetical protein BDY19DRAFT_1025640 [Irpex rosettiformis]|uniref:Uncharacterized protein n=1 Tax=Irpex rosettiformis TaxID=378272 RepID=A0ACB8TRA4_9APHY|nr:hypothetical protein BDY19DRAFT_1025640 [Irpex rosettiformis]
MLIQSFMNFFSHSFIELSWFITWNKLSGCEIEDNADKSVTLVMVIVVIMVEPSDYTATKTACLLKLKIGQHRRLLPSWKGVWTTPGLLLWIGIWVATTIFYVLLEILKYARVAWGGGNERWWLDEVSKQKAEQEVKTHVLFYSELSHTVTSISARKFGDRRLGPCWIGDHALCLGRWDARTYPLSDGDSTSFAETLFPRQDYNNARVLDFQVVKKYAKRGIGVIGTTCILQCDVYMTSFASIVRHRSTLQLHRALGGCEKRKYGTNQHYDWLALPHDLRHSRTSHRSASPSRALEANRKALQATVQSHVHGTVS